MQVHNPPPRPAHPGARPPHTPRRGPDPGERGNPIARAGHWQLHATNRTSTHQYPGILPGAAHCQRWEPFAAERLSLRPTAGRHGSLIPTSCRPRCSLIVQHTAPGAARRQGTPRAQPHRAPPGARAPRPPPQLRLGCLPPLQPMYAPLSSFAGTLSDCSLRDGSWHAREHAEDRAYTIQ